MASARTAARTARAPRPSMTAEEQEENDLFTTQLMSMMGTFEQLAKNPRMQKLLKTKDYWTGSQAETSQQATSRQRQVTEPVERVPIVVTGRVQHVTQAQDPARNGHRSNEQFMHPTIPMHTSFPGYFGALRRDVDAYVRSCLVCQKVKFDRQKAPGLLQPLPIPDRPWESIAMDFVFDLPRTTTGNDGIWTIICRFSKQAHFIPVRKKIKPEHMVKIFMQNIFKYHGMPQSIVSDRDPRMTSLFWKALFENMGTTLKFSSSFHPQTNGQFEEANSTVLDLLKCYVSEHKAAWEQYLPLVEYAYNNKVHSSTGKAPFEIVEGGEKVPPIFHTKDKIFEADRYVEGWQEAYKKVKYDLEKTQAKQKRAADSHRRELLFKENDWVSQKISDVAYRLKLPEGWKIHNAFHVSLLRPFVGEVPEEMVHKEQPEVEELDEILIHEQILAHKDRKVKGKVARRYLVKFKNYSPMDAKWMEEAELADSPQLLQLYKEAFLLECTVT
ncbi:hypothetical protein L7F22_007379 [Adiantum nelumboides]|nr:hypothetical protein [Adiantum nelumboides]